MTRRLRPWTKLNDDDLRQMAGAMVPKDIAKQLRRKQRSIRWRAEMLHISLSVTRCYSMRQAMKALNISKYTLMKAKSDLNQIWERQQFRPRSGKSKYVISPIQIGRIYKHLKEKSNGDGHRLESGSGSTV